MKGNTAVYSKIWFNWSWNILLCSLSFRVGFVFTSENCFLGHPVNARLDITEEEVSDSNRVMLLCAVAVQLPTYSGAFMELPRIWVIYIWVVLLCSYEAIALLL